MFDSLPNAVMTVCYGKEEIWESREEAFKFFRDCAYNSEGCERERYLAVCMHIVEGKGLCMDNL